MKILKNKLASIFGDELMEIILTNFREKIKERVDHIKRKIVKSVLSFFLFIIGLIYVISGLVKFLEEEIFRTIPYGVVPALFGLAIILIAGMIKPRG